MNIYIGNSGFLPRRMVVIFWTILVTILAGCGDGGGSVGGATGELVDTNSGVEYESASSCNGVYIEPNEDAVAVIYANPAGTSFCFRLGIHYLTAPIFARTGDQYIGESGAILDGGGVITHAIFGHGGEFGQSNVAIRNLIVQNFHNFYDDFQTRNTIKVGDNWIVENNEIRYNYETGIHVGKGLLLKNNYIHHNGRYGLTGGPGLDQNILIDGNEIAFNNSRNLDWATAGTAKVVGSTLGATGLTWINNWVHDNNGHGIHHDGNSGPDIEIAFNLIERNEGSGIQHEISWGINIHDNFIVNNARQYLGKSCFHGAQVLNNNSSNMRIINNHIESTEGANGICMVDTDSVDIFPFSETVTNCEVIGNTIKLVGDAMNGFVNNGEFAPYDVTDVLFDANTYFLPGYDMGSHWAFTTYPLTKAEWQGNGQDLNGVFHNW